MLWARTKDELAAAVSGTGRPPERAADAVAAGRRLLEPPLPADEIGALIEA